MKLFKKIITTPISCNADQNKPECSLIKELQDIQCKMQLTIQSKNKMNTIMEQLAGSEYGMAGNYYNHINNKYPIITLCYKGSKYNDIDGIDEIIDLLQQYKEATIEYNECSKQKKHLLQREQEIKTLLGIR